MRRPAVSVEAAAEAEAEAEVEVKAVAVAVAEEAVELAAVRIKSDSCDAFLYRSEARPKATSFLTPFFGWLIISVAASQSSFQMTVESTCAIAIAKLGDWVKSLAPVISTDEKQSHGTL